MPAAVGAIIAASVLVGAAASADRAPSRPAVKVGLAPVVRDTVLASGVVPVTLRARRDGRVTVRLALLDASGRTVARSRAFSVSLRRGRLRRLSLPAGDSIASLLQRCDGSRMAAEVAPRRGAALGRGRATARVGFTPPACGRFFADDSVWNRAVPSGAPLDPASGAVTGELLRQVQADITSGRGPWINTTRFSVPIYTVSARQPRLPVALPAGSDPALARALSDVPLPASARPSPDSDAELVVWQPATDTLWEFWRLQRGRGGQWRATTGGRIDRASSSPGHYQAPRAHWGVAASGFSIAGGLITVPELRRGRIDHALAMALPDVRADAFALPATSTDGRSAGATRVPEGAHFRLDPTLDLDGLGLPPVTRMLAEAAQHYGIVVRDRAGGVTLYAEDPAPLGTDPFPALFGGSASDVLRPFPWDRLQLLRMVLQPAPNRPPNSGCALLAPCS
jgi:hypothetical protein